MDRKHFLDSQLWLRHLPVTAMDKLRANFTFYAILTDAICCFQVEKSLVFFASGSPGSDMCTRRLIIAGSVIDVYDTLTLIHDEFYQIIAGDGHHASPDDATQLDLQVLLCLCEEAENKSEGEQQSVPALFFVLDGQSYIVNHTLISRISFPQTFSGSSEPPSAYLGDLAIH